jgi:D-inositol-3-phosphate glycosyltransferase
MGRFHIQKGFDIVIRAFVKERFSDARLLVIGDGPEMAELRRVAASHDSIQFIARTDDPALFLQRCHIVAMPSRWEPYGLVALEAMAAGRTVLCPAIDGLKDHIANGALSVPQNVTTDWISLFHSLKRKDFATPRSEPKDVANAELEFHNKWHRLLSTAASHNDTAVAAA